MSSLFLERLAAALQNLSLDMQFFCPKCLQKMFISDYILETKTNSAKIKLLSKAEKIETSVS